MDKLGKEKSKPLPQYKVQKATWGQFLDFFVKPYVVQWISWQTKKKVSLYPNLNDKHTQRTILGL